MAVLMGSKKRIQAWQLPDPMKAICPRCHRLCKVNGTAGQTQHRRCTQCGYTTTTTIPAALKNR